MRDDEPACTAQMFLRMNPAAEGRVAPMSPSRKTTAGISERDREAIRPDPRPGSFNVWEIALVSGLVAVALEFLPRPASIPAAMLTPVIYLIGRDHTRLFLFLASVGVALAPSLITGERLDIELRNVTLLALTPLYLRLLTWSDNTGRWDVLDPLVLSGLPISFVTVPALVFRLFTAASLIGESPARGCQS